MVEKEDKGMTIREASKALGIKVRTVREWIRTGRLRAEKHGKQWVILADIDSDEIQARIARAQSYIAGQQKRVDR